MKQRRKISNYLFTIIGLLFLIIAILFSICFFYDKLQQKKETNTIIDEVFTEDFLNIEEIKKEEKNIQDNLSNENITKKVQLSNSYLGYIEIPTLNIRNLIVYGTEKNTLNKGYVGLMNISANIDDQIGNIILAGHNVNSVFKKLHYSKIGENIKIVTHKNSYNFKITEKYVISDNDMSHFRKSTDKKILTLVTCRNNIKERLIVVAELRRD